MQSPARARYSPLASTAGSGDGCCAVAILSVAPTNRDEAARAVSCFFKVRGMCTIPSVRLAAARKRHQKTAARRERRIGGRRTRCEKGRDGFHIVFRQQAGDNLHAIRRSGGACAISPSPELRADVAGAQAEQARYCRLQSAEGRTVASRTRRDAVLRVAIFDQRFASRQNFVAHCGDRRRWKWRPQRREMFGNLFQIGVGEKIQQVVHRRVFAAPVPECDQLVVEITRRLSREPREIDVAGALALSAVARRAGENAGRHGVGCAIGRLRLRSAKRKRDQNKKSENKSTASRHRYNPSSTSPEFRTLRKEEQRNAG